MKTIWKIVIGVVVVILVIGLVGGVVLAGRLARFSTNVSGYSYRINPRTAGPGVYGVIPFYMGPGYAGRGFLSTGPVGWLGMGLFMLGRLLFPLLLVALIVGLAIALFRRPARQVAPVQAIPNPLPPQPPVTSEMAGTCSNCGKPLQADWAVCPYCGQKTTPKGAA